MPARLDIDSLRTLKAVHELGGITRAANALALSQSAVSHKIRRLEESIDARLLRRQPGTPLLTNEGERLLDYAVRIIGLHDEALSSLGRKSLQGKIRLGITEDTTSAGLARILARFARHYPAVTVKTHVAQSLTLDRQLAEGQIDLAVMQVLETEVRDGDRLLSRDRLHWVQARDFDLSERNPLPFIAFDRDCFYRHWAFEQAKRQGLKLECVLECYSIGGVSSAVGAGLGVALLGERYMGADMRVLEGDFPTPPAIAYVIRSRRDISSLPTAALSEEIIAEMTVDATPTIQRFRQSK